MKNSIFFGVLLTTLMGTMALNAQTMSRTYSWHGVTLKYPSNYSIAEDINEEGLYIFHCAVDGDDLSIMTVTIVRNEMFSMFSEEELLEIGKEGVEDAFEEANATYTNISMGGLMYETKDDAVTVTSSATAELMGIPLLLKMIVLAKGKMFVSVFLQAESKEYMNELQMINETITLE